MKPVKSAMRKAGKKNGWSKRRRRLPERIEWALCDREVRAIEPVAGGPRGGWQERKFGTALPERDQRPLRHDQAWQGIAVDDGTRALSNTDRPVRHSPRGPVQHGER